MTENVWDYPRPPRLEPSDERVTVEFGGIVIVDTTAALRVLETSHPPTYYLPRTDALPGVLQPSVARQTFCEFKGLASNGTLRAGDRIETDVAW